MRIFTILMGENTSYFQKKVIDIINENKTPVGPEPCPNNTTDNEKLIYVLMPGIIMVIILAFIFIKFRKQ